jgi:uncharacterized membrane protein YqjE
MKGSVALVKAAPALMALAALAILSVGLAHGWHALLISLVLVLPVLLVLFHGLWKTREVS